MTFTTILIASAAVLVGIPIAGYLHERWTRRKTLMMIKTLYRDPF